MSEDVIASIIASVVVALLSGLFALMLQIRGEARRREDARDQADAAWRAEITKRIDDGGRASDDKRHALANKTQVDINDLEHKIDRLAENMARWEGRMMGPGQMVVIPPPPALITGPAVPPPPRSLDQP